MFSVYLVILEAVVVHVSYREGLQACKDISPNSLGYTPRPPQSYYKDIHHYMIIHIILTTYHIHQRVPHVHCTLALVTHHGYSLPTIHIHN